MGMVDTSDEQDAIGAVTTMTPNRRLWPRYSPVTVTVSATGSSHPRPLPVWQVVVAC